jgi:hypothetical protein
LAASHASAVHATHRNNGPHSASAGTVTSGATIALLIWSDLVKPFQV